MEDADQLLDCEETEAVDHVEQVEQYILLGGVFKTRSQEFFLWILILQMIYIQQFFSL